MAVNTRGPTAAEPEPAWRQHLPWVATLVAFSYATLKIAVISSGDPDVARAVVATSDLATLLLGLGALALPMLVAVVGYISLLATFSSIQTSTRLAMPLSLAVGSFILLAILAPTQAPLTVLSTALSTIVVLSFGNPRNRDRDKMRLPEDASWKARIGRLLSVAGRGRRVVAVILALGLLLPFWTNGLGSAFDRTVWLPLELVCTSAEPETIQGQLGSSGSRGEVRPCLAARVTSSTGSERMLPNLGYVLEAGAAWTTVLLEDQRRVVRLPSNAIMARVVCQSPEVPGLDPLLDSAIAPAAEDEGMLVQLGAAEYQCYPSLPVGVTRP